MNRGIRCAPRRFALVGACMVCCAGSLLVCTEYDSSLLRTSDASAPGQDGNLPDVVTDTLMDRDARDAPRDQVTDPTQEEAQLPGDCDWCKNRALPRPSCPPTVDDPPSGEDLVFATRSARLGMAPNNPQDWQSLGVDLDCLETRGGQPSMCEPPAPDTQLVEDGLGGRDNSFGNNVGGAVRLLEGMSAGFQTELAINNDFELGRHGLLMALSNVGEGPNDPLVQFAMYLSTGTHDPNGDWIAPKWDGTDTWSRVSDWMVAGQPLYADDSAYLVDNVLVAHLPDGLPVRFQGSVLLEVSLNSSVVVATLSDDHTEIVDGTLAGVWYAPVALMAFDSILGQLGVCPGSIGYDLPRSLVERSPDIRLDPSEPPGAHACNAISLGIGFTAERAGFGDTVALPPPPVDRCLDGGTDGGAGGAGGVDGG